MIDTTDRERIVLVDVSMTTNSAQALRILEEFAMESGRTGRPARIDLNAGSLLMTQNVLSKARQILGKWNVRLETVYALLPQTQQAALDEGFFVKERPQSRSGLGLASSGFWVDHKNIAEKTETPTQEPEKVVALNLPLFSQDATGVAFENTDKKNIDPLLSFDVTAPFEPPVIPALTEAVDTKPTLETQPFQIDLPADTDTQTPTMFLKQTIRSGQVVRYPGNIVIIGDVHGGGEVAASGDITVWGELKGIAHAGIGGNYRAEIRALKIEAIQLRIADYIARRPDRIFYHKPLAPNAVAPELAKVSDGEIKIFKEVVG